MLDIDRILNTPSQLQGLTGLNLHQFNLLEQRFDIVYNDYEKERKRNQQSKRSKRDWNGGYSAKLLPTTKEKLMFILVYFKVNPLQEFLAASFDMSQSEASKKVAIFSKLLDKCFTLEERPSQDPQILMKLTEGSLIAIDGTERPITRSVDYETQKEHYSGKTKQHSVKNIIVSHLITLYIIFISLTVEGKRHDEKLRKDEKINFPPYIHLGQDTGFQGHKPKNVTLHQPEKKLKGIELTAAQKAANKLHSAFRVPVEHSIGRIKIFRVTKDIFRGRRKNAVNDVIITAASLVNFRILNTEDSLTNEIRKNQISSLLCRK